LGCGGTSGARCRFQGIGYHMALGELAGRLGGGERQSSSWNTAQDARCVINLAVALAPWLDWMRESLGALPKSVSASLGLYRDRLHPAGTRAGVDGWWQISGDADAIAAAVDMVAQLAAHGWPTLPSRPATGPPGADRHDSFRRPRIYEGRTCSDALRRC
jgi:hypothetical protein